MSSELHLDGREVEDVIAGFGRVLDELRDAHVELTERAAHMEQELCQKLAELEAILHDLPTGVVVRDAEGAVQRVNPAAEVLLGEEQAALRGRRELAALDALPADGTPRPLPTGAGGQPHVVALRRSPVTLPDGTPAGSVEILDDRTELETLARRVHQQAKMAALGTMAGGIAHEVRNPLNAVRGFAALLAERVPEDTTEARWAGLIQQGVDECDAIIGSVLAFAAPERLTVERLDAAELATAAIDAVRQELTRCGRGDAYELCNAVFPGLYVEGDRIQLRQSLRNLIANAVDAQLSGGVVHVEARPTAAGCELRVHDAGPGIPSELAARVSDPFFTTRAEGTGLGLALVHTVARLHGGNLDVCTAPGPLGGADLRLVIPMHAPIPFSPACDPCDAR